MKRAICLAVCLILCVGVLASCGGPKGVISKLEKAINKGDVDAFIKCWTPEEQKELKREKDDVKEWLNKLTEDGKFKIKVNDIEYNDDKTKATAYCTFTQDGETDDEKIWLEKVDGKWYISDF